MFSGSLAASTFREMFCTVHLESHLRMSWYGELEIPLPNVFHCVLAIKNVNNHTSGRLLTINYLDWSMKTERPLIHDCLEKGVGICSIFAKCETIYCIILSRCKAISSQALEKHFLYLYSVIYCKSSKAVYQKEVPRVYPEKNKWQNII